MTKDERAFRVWHEFYFAAAPPEQRTAWNSRTLTRWVEWQAATARAVEVLKRLEPQRQNIDEASDEWIRGFASGVLDAIKEVRGE